MNIQKLRDEINKGNNEFKNYGDLCKVLEIKKNGGTSKIGTINNLRKYFNFKKDGYKFIFEKVEDETTNKLINKTTKTLSAKDRKKMNKAICDLIIYDLSKLKGKDGVIIGSATHMLYNLSMVNERFKDAIKRVDVVSEKYDLELKVSSEWFTLTKKKMVNDLEKALKSLERNDYLKWYKINIVSVKDAISGEYYHREAKEIEEQYRMECSRKALKTIGVDNHSDLHWNGKKDEYYKNLKRIYKENPSIEYGCDEEIEYFYAGYKIVYTDNIINEYLQRAYNNSGAKSIINEVTKNGVIKNVYDRHYKAKRDKTKEKYSYREKVSYVETGILLVNEFIDTSTKRVVIENKNNK